MPPVIAANDRFRDQLARQDAEALERLARAYARIAKRLEDKIELLTLQIGESQPSREQVLDMTRYRALLSQTADELQRFVGVVQEEILRSADLNIPLGEYHARQLVSTIIAGDGRVAGRFNVLPKAAIESILGFLNPDSPLFARIKELAPFTAEQVTNAIVEGVGLGHNPRKIAQEIRVAYGQGLTNALRLTRTAQLYSYREASRASYVVNADVVGGWYWTARLNRGTCISCICQHGSLHPLDERLNDHHNGRCAMTPAVKGFPSPFEQTGEQWFEQQPAIDQRYQMGKGRYAAWQDGRVTFDRFSSIRTDDIYGKMRVAATLKELLGE